MEAVRWAVVQRFQPGKCQRPGESVTTAPEEMAQEFTDALLDATRTISPEETRRRRTREWYNTSEMRVALEDALAKRWEVRCTMRGNWASASWRTLKKACTGVAAEVEKGLHARLDRYVTDLEAIYTERDMRGLYRHLKRSACLSGRQARGQQNA